MSICDFLGTTIRSILYSAVGVFAIGMQAFARTILVSAQPVSPYAYTEVSTNVVIQTGVPAAQFQHCAASGLVENRSQACGI